jgi:cullin 1
LQWTHTLGNAVVKGMFGKKSYQLQITTLQAVVLLSFNCDIMKDRTQWPFIDLLETIDMPEEILKRVLHSLSCGKFKVLKKISAIEGGDKKDEKTIRSSDSFIFNDTFTCQLNKIRKLFNHFIIFPTF